MKITRYPQSCLLIENDEGRMIVIDPGAQFLDSHQRSELDGVSAVLYTHRHADHYEPDIAAYLFDKGVEVYANRESAETIGDERVRVIDDGERFEVAGFVVQTRDLPHCALPDGSAGPQNTGYVIDNVLFHPGDGKELQGLVVDAMALPIQGPDISFRDAVAFAEQVKAKVVIPIHFDVMGAKPEIFKAFTAGTPFEVRVLGDGESTTI